MHASTGGTLQASLAIYQFGAGNEQTASAGRNALDRLTHLSGTVPVAAIGHLGEGCRCKNAVRAAQPAACPAETAASDLRTYHTRSARKCSRMVQTEASRLRVAVSLGAVDRNSAGYNTSGTFGLAVYRLHCHIACTGARVDSYAHPFCRCRFARSPSWRTNQDDCD